jgi:ADP-heptose:LPS heptosyltransferase
MAAPALKWLERTVKRGVIAAATRVVPRGSAVPPDWSARVHRVLYLRYDRIGDMIMATGLIRAIATSHATIHLDVLASPVNHTVLDGNPHVHRVHVFDRRRATGFLGTARALSREGYDAVIGGMLLPSATTMGLMLATRAPHRIGVAPTAGEHVYTIAVPAVSAERRFVEQIGQTVRAFGVDPETQDWHYDLFFRDDERARAEAAWQQYPGWPRVLVNISAHTSARHWPADRYAAVVRHVRARVPEASVLVTGDPSEWNVSQAVASAAKATAVGVTPVREAFALIAAADALVTPDTSLAHVAAATGTPAAVLINGNRTIDAPVGERIVRITAPGELSTLAVADVLPGVERLLALAAQPPGR